MRNGKLEDELLEKARDLGAANALVFSTEEIVFDSRTLLKCMYGCESWGFGHTCPSAEGALKPWEYERVFSEYDWGILIHTHDRHSVQSISYKLEQRAFLLGNFFAISLCDCSLCDECAGFEDEPCRHPERARPSMQSVGINVEQTVHQFDLPLKVLRDEDEQANWYAAVFVD